ncbi:helix-turn-helix domain-containing protein [Rhodobacter sp. NSM]|uniref:helix-turn-helix domain-containing protein n=1 Tax=Rhodobacter sp. NSM TaxID=3457501 RepID=UPI003FD27796
MKLPNNRQGGGFGNFRIAAVRNSDNPEPMDRDPISQLVAENLERLLKERDMSALALGKKCKLGRSTVYDILDGRSESPRLKTIAALADGLGVPLSDMFLTRDQLQAQSELLRAYQMLPPAEQKRLAQVAKAWRLD